MPMRCSRALNRAAALLLSLAATGCSTFEVYDLYRPPDADTLEATPGAGLNRLSVHVPRDYRFYSIGPIGLPVIPLPFGLGRDTNIRLRVGADLADEIDLSMAGRPCVRTASDDTLCPTRMTLFAGASFPDDGSMHADGKPRWHLVPAFADPNRQRPEIALTDATGPITLADIYRHYGYDGTPKWGHMTISLEYLYPCASACPEAFTVDTADLVSVAGRPMLDGPTTFRMTRERHYEFFMLTE